MNLVFLKWILVLFIVFISANEDQCPSKCSCRRSTQRDGTDYIKLRCGETEKITSLDEIDLLNIASEIIQFNLSDNQFTTFYPKVQLIALQKLDLSRNHLTELQNNQFSEFPHLRRLDISSNNIKTIELLTFANLEDLERLKLNQNQISSITLGTFDPLIHLKQLDISNNPLTCDCGLLWLLDWTQKQSVKLVSNPKCNSPSTFKGLPLRKLKVGVDIHCKSAAGNNGLPIIEMTPDFDQVVFEGDSLMLQCRAPSIFDSPTSSKIEWTWLEQNVKTVFPEIIIENNFMPSNSIIDSKLKISNLKREYAGLWNCSLISIQGNYSTAITIVVITKDTHYCPVTVTKSNKGTYTWPQTIVNHTVTIPCESINLNYDIFIQKVSYACTEQGEWKDLNTSTCAYVSETTKILEQFSKVNSSIIESVKHFRNYTSNLKHFQDVMDVVFAVNTITNYLNYLSVDQIGGILIDVSNNLLDLPKKYLKKADEEYQICAKLINTTEVLAGITSSSLLHKSNIAVELFPVKKNGFMGLKCTWYSDLNHQSDRLFYCLTNSQSETSEFNGKIPEASVTIPETLFYQLEEKNNFELKNKVYNILVAMYASNKLFPLKGSRGDVEDVTSAVVGTKLADISVNNLSDPVFITLKTPSSPIATYGNFLFTPVWWNPMLRNGSGDWSSDGCQVSNEIQEHITFFCYNFGYYGLLQDITYLKTLELNAKFKLSHPAIYVGSFILFISFLLAISTYLFCYNSIQMPKKAKHSFINMWIAIVLLCFMYVFGIYQTENRRLCEIVGMLLHYFTLSSLLWMCVGVNCMYKRLSKNDIMQLQDDELPTDQPIKKPIIGLYFVGWGVAMIVCGISAAINIKEYSSATYCFLRIGPPLSALYIPFAILLIFLGIFFLLIRCAIYNLDTNGHLSEGTQATENVDLDLLEPNFPESRSVRSNSTKTASSEIEDSEHAPSAQLKAYIIFLVIYILTWLSCAFATVEPFHFVSFEEDLFSIAYAVLATMLSAFTLFFYCVARNDVRTQWVLFSRWLKRKRICFRSRNISDTNLQQIQIQPLPLPVPINTSLTAGDVIQVTSRSSSRSSSRTKSNSHNSNILKTAAAVDLNGPNYNENHGTKINNVNLIVLHRQQYRANTIPNIIENPTNAAEVFYNPHQSTVARKFFKRQKRHMMKRNNLTTRNCDLTSDTASIFSEMKQMKDNSSVDQSIFGTNSKVNNTNIHVEHIRKIQQRNPNIFSDSADDCDSITNNVPPVEHLVLNAERLRKKEILKHKTKKKQLNKSFSGLVENNMRSVSQQCTLDYSSENISDSILDKNSPDKINSGQLLLENFLTDFTEINKAVNVSSENLHFLPDNNSDITLINDGKEVAAIATSATAAAAAVATSAATITEINYNPSSEISLSLVDSSISGGLNETVPIIYVNPSHDLHNTLQTSVQSRASSVSVSDLDELYQQIRRGPTTKTKKIVNNYSFIARGSPLCLSDSEIHSYVSDIKYKQRASRSNDNLSDSVETTV